MSTNEVFTKNYIRGKVAELLVSRMLKEVGHEVYTFGVENVAEYMVQRKHNGPDDGTLAQLKSTPDLVVRKNPHTDQELLLFIEVKFSSKKNVTYERDDAVKKQRDNWPSARIVRVAPAESLVFAIESNGSFSDELFKSEFRVPARVLERYIELSRELLGRSQ